MDFSGNRVRCSGLIEPSIDVAIVTNLEENWRITKSNSSIAGHPHLLHPNGIAIIVIVLA